MYEYCHNHTAFHFCWQCLKLADALMTGEIKNGFSLVRPPGHHALRVVHGNRGFCNINNEAILWNIYDSDTK